MEKAAFNFKGYHFKKAIIDFPTGNDFYDLQIAFNPSGVFDTQNSLYKLLLEIVVLTGEENNEHPIVDVTCEAEFQFSQKIEFNDIPTALIIVIDKAILKIVKIVLFLFSLRYLKVNLFIIFIIL